MPVNYTKDNIEESGILGIPDIDCIKCAELIATEAQKAYDEAIRKITSDCRLGHCKYNDDCIADFCNYYCRAFKELRQQLEKGE